MELMFANPAGWWGLIGLPILLAIHMLHRRARRLPISTLFLLDPLTRESEQGRVWDRLRLSVPLWLQCLAVLALTWLLLQPRWRRSDSWLRTVVVLDSSASMQACRDEVLARLPGQLAAMDRVAGQNEWMIIESDPQAPTRYSGPQLAEAVAALSGWRPRRGDHDPAPAAETALSLARGEGVVVFVTDRPPNNIPPGVQVWAVGEPIENCGLAGMRIEERDGAASWQALAINFSDGPQRRDWWLEIEGRPSTPSALEFEPNQVRTLKGAWPLGAERVVVALGGDRFPMDDRLPMMRPRSRTLSYEVRAHRAARETINRFARSMPDLQPAASGTPADLEWVARSAAEGVPTEGSAVVFLRDTGPDEEMVFRPDAIVPESVDWMNRLNWQGLLVRGRDTFAIQPDDEVLLWQGTHPLMFRRMGARRHLLVFNFDVTRSNAHRIPATLLLLHRFVESARSHHIGYAAANVEVDQRIEVACEPGGPAVALERWSGSDPAAGADRESGGLGAVESLRAPPEPGYFRVGQGRRVLLEGAAQFADTRESDFRGAGSTNTLAGVTAALSQRNSRADRFTALWTLLIGGCIVAAWAWPLRRAKPAP
jgi:hypothetical protein